VKKLFSLRGLTWSDTPLRRLELLKLEGLGFSRAEIVNELSQKAACTKRAIYKDFETRESWQPELQSVIDPKAVLMKVINRYEQIYRQASMRLLTSSSELAQLGALNVMLKANSLLSETAVLPELMGKLKVLEDKAAKGVFVP
jgi:hypothetical protein